MYRTKLFLDGAYLGITFPSPDRKGVAFLNWFRALFLATRALMHDPKAARISCPNPQPLGIEAGQTKARRKSPHSGRPPLAPRRESLL